jgi:hypothetical protein
MARHGRTFPLRWRRPGLATFAQLAVTGTASIGTSYPATAGSALAGETTTGALGFGPPSFSLAGAVSANHGNATFTSAAASLSASGDELVSGTADITGAAASLAADAVLTFSGSAALTTSAATLAGTGDLDFTGTADITTAAATLDSAGLLAYNGPAAFTSAAASLSGLGSEAFSGTADLTGAAASFAATGNNGVGITGDGAFTGAPAVFTANGRTRRQTGGHDVVDLARYNDFVDQAIPILEELGQPLPEPLPAVEIRPPDIAALVEHAMAAVPVLPAPPALTVQGKAWIRGAAASYGSAPAIVGTGTVELVAKGYVWMPHTARVTATGTVDNYYTIRKHDDEFIAAFIQSVLLGRAA